MIQMLVTDEEGCETVSEVRHATVRKTTLPEDAPGWWVEWAGGLGGASGAFSLDGTGTQQVIFRAVPDNDEPADS